MRARVLLLIGLSYPSFACEDDGPGALAPDADLAPADAGFADTSPADTSPSDALLADSSAADASTVDSSASDVSPADTSPADASATDLGAPDTGGPADAGDCAATAGFCWLNPAGLGASLSAVSGADDDDVWAVGADGVLVRFGPNGLEQWPSPASSSLNDVHARTTADVWAVGDAGAVIHFDGNAWQLVPGVGDDDLRAVFAIDASNVWIAGRRGLYHFDGQSLSPSALPFQYDLEGTALFAFSASDVWLGTVFGTLLHYDGNTWSYSEDFYHNDAVTDLWGASPSDLWAVSDYGADVSRFDGADWRRVPYEAGVSPENVRAVHGRGSDDVWLAGQLGLYHYDGQTFTRHDPPVAQYASIAPTGVRVGANRTLVVGLAGHVFDFSNNAWSLASGPMNGIYMRWFDIEAVAANDVWFFGLGTSMRWNGVALTEVPTVATTYRQDFVGSWAASANDMWIVGIGEWGDNVQRYDGNTFSRVQSGNFSGPDWVLGVWGSSANDVYFAAEGDSFHWDGSSFERLQVNAAFEAIHGTGASDVWAVSGTGGSSSVPPHPSNGIWHFDGQMWTQVEVDGVWWSSIHALAPNDVWAGGGGGTIKHWNGNTWTTMSIPGFSTQDPQNAPFVGSFAARASNDVYATAGSRLLHFDGANWTVLPSFGVGLSAVAVASDGAVYVTGGSDAVLRKR